MLIPASQKSFCAHAEPQIFPSPLPHIPHPYPQQLKRGNSSLSGPHLVNKTPLMDSQTAGLVKKLMHLVAD